MTRIAVLILAFAGVLCAQVAGDWEGSISTPGGALRVRVHVKAATDGSLTATTDSPDQGAFDLPLSDVNFTDGVFRWNLAMAGALFEGKLNEAGEIAGTLKQNGMDMPLTLKRFDAAAAAPARPQEPKPPFPYRAEDVSFSSKAAGVTLAGTLTIPQGKGPFPAAVLVTGSGPQNRNEEIFGHKPFFVLADYLTRHGIAVLRYDDRGFGKPAAEFRKATTADFADDAEGAFDFLKSRPEVDAKHTGIIGHSEGGLIGPMVAARRADVGFIVLMAGPGVSGAETMKVQAAKIARVSGAPESAIEQNTQGQEKIFQILREEKDDAAAREKIVAALGDSPRAKAEAEQDTSPWFRFFAFYDPAPALEKTKCPVLALNGELDMQVVADQQLPAVEAALKKGGNTQYEIVRLPGLNHLFQTAKTGSIVEYRQIEETMSPVALEKIAGWINARR